MILPPFDSEASNFRQLAPSTFGHQELAVTAFTKGLLIPEIYLQR